MMPVGDAGRPLSFLRVDFAELAAATEAATARERMSMVRGGRHQAFRWEWRPLPARPEDWHRHPRSHSSYPTGVPWWRVPLLSPSLGDVKDVWEPARFAWVYDLIRGRAIGECDAPAIFFDHLAGWIDGNPPFRGVHWACGQETSIRAVALLYAEANLADDGAVSAEQRLRLARVLAWSGERIADAIGYAISQRNNHALSEALGLALLGARFEGHHPDARRWWETGARLFDRLVLEQFAPDGWYIQHSMTYMRLALDACVVAERLGQSRGQPLLSAEGRARIRAAYDLLLAVVDSQGDVPNHGANDGAFVHPITLGSYRDFRPLLTALSATFDFPLPADVEADVETMAWLGRPIVRTDRRVEGARTGTSGWAVVRRGRVHLFFRAGRYASRPGHIDPLHLDLRVDGRPLIADAGSYAYNAAPPFDRGLGGAVLHNGPLVDGREPGMRGPRFLWYQWPDARLDGVDVAPDRVTLRAEGDEVARTVTVHHDHVEVLDAPRGDGARRVSVSWLLAPGVSPALIQSEAIREEVSATDRAPEGWVSWRYGEHTRGTTVRLSADATSASPLRTRIDFPPPHS